MRVFKDTESREWQVAINVASVKRVRQLMNVDIYKLIDRKLEPLEELLADPVAFVDVLYVLCKPQCDSLKVSDEDFGRGMGGDVLESAADVFVEELIDFFQNPKARNALRVALNKARQLREMVLAKSSAKVDVRLNSLDQTTLEKMADAIISRMENQLNASSGNSPESLE